MPDARVETAIPHRPRFVSDGVSLDSITSCRGAVANFLLKPFRDPWNFYCSTTVIMLRIIASTADVPSQLTGWRSNSFF